MKHENVSNEDEDNTKPADSQSEIGTPTSPPGKDNVFNSFVPYANLSHPAPNMYTTTSNSKVGHAKQTARHRLQNSL